MGARKGFKRRRHTVIVQIKAPIPEIKKKSRPRVGPSSRRTIEGINLLIRFLDTQGRKNHGTQGDPDITRKTLTREEFGGAKGRVVQS